MVLVRTQIVIILWNMFYGVHGHIGAGKISNHFLKGEETLKTDVMRQ